MVDQATLQSFVGRPAGKPMTRLPVNEAMIGHWCEALGDRNPVYTDPEAAKRSIHGGLVAPPAMLQAWTMRGLEPRPDDPEDGERELIRTLSEAGFTAIVATNCEQEYRRYLRPGDLITATTVIDSVSEEKKTALGSGHFYTTKTTYTDQDGAVVGTQIFRLLKYRPAATASKKTARRPRPAINSDTEFFWEGLKRGELLAQRCASCGTLRHPPRPMCGSCRSLEWKEERLTGRGEVYSFVLHHYPEVPSFEIPYVVALVQLEEGLRIISNVVGVAPSEVHVGMPVEVSFEVIDEELALPLFSPRSA